MNARVDFFVPEFRKSRKFFGDLLRHASLVEDGIILGKGGELITSVRYRGQDLDCASPQDLWNISQRVNTAVMRFGTGWMWHCTSARRSSEDYPSTGEFPDVASRLVENERRRQYKEEGSHFENEYIWTFTYVAPTLLAQKAQSFVFEKEEGTVVDSQALALKELALYKKRIEDLINELSSDMGRMEPLKARYELNVRTKKYDLVDDQISYLLWCATGIHQMVKLPEYAAPVGLDMLIGSQSFSGGLRPMVGSKNVRVIAIESPPEMGTEVGMLDILNSVPVDYRWTTRWIARNAEHAKTELEEHGRKWRQKVRGFSATIFNKQNGRIDGDAAAMANDVESAIQDINAGKASYGHFTSTIVLMDDDEAQLNASVLYLIKVLRTAHFVVRDEDVNCIEAFLGSIPGHGYENIKRPLYSSENLTHLLPLSSIWQGQDKHPCDLYRKLYGADEEIAPLMYGSSLGGTPFKVHLHHGDVGHTLIVGPTGAGKSTLLALMALQHFRYRHAKVFAFDKGESMYVACAAAGGEHYNFLSEDEGAQKIGLCPFARVDRTGERIWASGYVQTLMEQNGITVTLDHRQDINEGLRLLGKKPVHMRNFTVLKGLVQEAETRAVLAMYESELAGGMLNAERDSISLGRFTVFELEELMSMGDEHVVPVLLYLFRAIERSLDGSPVLLILDEAWLMLNHPLFRAKIREWLKVLRKANASVIFATQELEDLAKSEIRSTIFSACKTRIFLPASEALSETGQLLYKEMGLADRERHVVGRSRPKQDYFYHSPAGRRLFQLELGPIALALVATSGKTDRLQAKALKQQYGDNWLRIWLQSRKVDTTFLDEAQAELEAA